MVTQLTQRKLVGWAIQMKSSEACAENSKVKVSPSLRYDLNDLTESVGLSVLQTASAMYLHFYVYLSTPVMASF